MRVITDEQFKKICYALEMNRVMAQDVNGDYTKEVTPKIITEALEILAGLEHRTMYV